MLQLLFPRTTGVAAVALAWQAARREHDRRIGRVGAFHLFRLPSATEEQLSRLLRKAGPDQRLAAETASYDAALAALREIAGPRSLPEIEAGPRRIGSIVGLERSESSLRELANAYLAAVVQGRQIYPYFTEAGA